MGGRGVKRGKYLSQCLLRGAAFYECIVWEVMDGNLQTLLILMLNGFCVWVCVCVRTLGHTCLCVGTELHLPACGRGRLQIAKILNNKKVISNARNKINQFVFWRNPKC